MTDHQSDDPARLRELLLELQVRRDALDAEAAALVAELTAPQVDVRDGATAVAPLGLPGDPLVDAEGYPRADVDLYRARTLRGRLVELQTDRAALQADLERHLARLHALLRANGGGGGSGAGETAAPAGPRPRPRFDAATGRWTVTTSDGTVIGGRANTVSAATGSRAMPTDAGTAPAPAPALPPSVVVAANIAPSWSSDPLLPATSFAVIDSVAPDSPAAEAGLLPGDQLRAVEGLEPSAADSDPQALLEQVGRRVAAAAAHGATLRVWVQRPNADEGPDAVPAQELLLRPRPWAGRGLLGCHLLPIR